MGQCNQTLLGVEKRVEAETQLDIRVMRYSRGADWEKSGFQMQDCVRKCVDGLGGGLGRCHSKICPI